MFNQSNQEQQSKKRQQKQLQNQYKRRKFVEAHQLSHFDIMLSMVKIGMKGSNEQKQEKLRKRILKFFDYGDKSIDITKQYFCERREPNRNDNSVANELIFYGIDFMSIKVLRKRLQPLIPRIQRMDDSHYKVIFQNQQEAFQAIELNIKDQTILKVKAEEEQFQVSKSWFQLKPYYQLGYERKLFCRHATTSEDQHNFKESEKLQIYKKAKKQVQQQIYSEAKKIYNEQLSLFANGDRKFGNTRRKQTIVRERSREKRNSRSYDEPFKRGTDKRKTAASFPEKQDNRQNNQSDSDEDNYDFILSPHELNELGKEFQELGLDDKISEIEQKNMEEDDLPSVNLEIQLENISNSAFNNSRRHEDDLDLDYENENAMKKKQTINTDNPWSYRDYMEQQQKKQEKNKRRNVIVIDD